MAQEEGYDNLPWLTGIVRGRRERAWPTWIVRGLPAKTEGDLLSSRDYEDAPENLSQAPPLQPVIPFQACQA